MKSSQHSIHVLSSSSLSSSSSGQSIAAGSHHIKNLALWLQTFCNRLHHVVKNTEKDFILPDEPHEYLRGNFVAIKDEQSRKCCRIL